MSAAPTPIIDLFGDADLMRVFDAAPAAIQRDVLRGAIARAGKPLDSAMRVQIATLTSTPRGKNRGRLHRRDAIVQRSRSYRSALLSVIGPDYAVAPHAHLVERGHLIVPHKSRQLAGVRRRARPKKATRERAQEKPFAATAFQQTKDQVLATLQSELNTGVVRVMGSLGKP